jgi:hypothetical protein
MTLVLMVCLPYMEYAILPKNSRQLPVIGHRSPRGGGVMRDATCQLEKLGKFSGNDSREPADCSSAMMQLHVVDHNCHTQGAPAFHAPQVPVPETRASGGAVQRGVGGVRSGFERLANNRVRTISGGVLIRCNAFPIRTLRNQGLEKLSL